jgi:hypothetical protein
MSFVQGIEPELQQPPPRRIRRRSGKSAGCGKGCAGLFLLPHTVVGIGMLVAAFMMTFIALLGTSIPATITGRLADKDSDGDPRYQLKYTYQYENVTYQKWAGVSLNTYSTWPDGAPTSVKLLPLPFVSDYPRLMVPGNKSMSVLGIWGFALFWNGIVGVFWWGIVITPRNRHRLVRHGMPVKGRVLHKRILKGSYGDTHYVKYEYVPTTIEPQTTSNGMPVLPQSPFSGFTTGPNASPFASGVHANPVELAPDSTTPTGLPPLNPVEADTEALGRAEAEKVVIRLKSLSPVELFSNTTWEGVKATLAQAKAKAAEEEARIAAMTTPGATVREVTAELVDWNKVREGDLVTVLYDPRKPQRSVVYLFSEYEAVL